MVHQISYSTDQLHVCPACDLLVNHHKTTAGHFISCPRCHKVLHKYKKNSIDKTLALALSGLALYLPAMFLPLMTMESLGMSESSNVLESIISFFNSGYYLVATMLLFSTAVFPLLLLSLISIVALQLKRGKHPSYLPKIFRYYLHLQEWGMVEVYLLGIIITIIKMTGTADISYDPGFFCFLGLVFASMGVTSVIDQQLFWKRMESHESKHHINTMNFDVSTGLSAKDAGFIGCHDCHKILHGSHTTCLRCGAALHSRKPNSISRTWALVITSMLFFIPANILPIMQVDLLGIPDRSTILDGIIYFFHHGSYGIGVIILTASILVPAFKVVGLLIILTTIRYRKNTFLQQKAKMFRFIEFIGRWSMLDIFVIALLTVLVDFGFLTSIHAAPAATYFCIVVVSTMCAAIAFDPRIMWDKCFQKTR